MQYWTDDTVEVVAYLSVINRTAARDFWEELNMVFCTFSREPWQVQVLVFVGNILDKVSQKRGSAG